MSSNKNALIRYNTIDRCLRNNTRLWTLEDLMEACSEALYEFEGKNDLVSKRTIQLDIQNMRSEKLGYNAPIEVFQRKYYRYSEPNFSIRNIPVNSSDIKIMNDAVQILKQFKDFSVFREMNGVIQKLEDSIYAIKEKAIIHLDKNEQLKGLEYIDKLYQSILNKSPLEIEYKSFQARDEKVYEVHPQLLKEYNNRWFLIAWEGNRMLHLALDRMLNIKSLDIPYVDRGIDADEYFSEVVGVTVSRNNRPRNVVFSVDSYNAPYVKTKPFHHTQELVKEDENGFCTFRIRVQLNYELERMILGFGNSLVVHSPKSLRQRIEYKMKKAVENYQKFND